jgi:hypothetical protein
LKNNYSDNIIKGQEANEPFKSIFKKDFLKFSHDDIKKYKGVTTKKKELMNASQLVVKYIYLIIYSFS